jgi:hypothetical protein
MKMKNTLRIILLTAFIGNQQIADAQGDCSQSLIQAERAYYNGRFNEIEPMLKGCIADGFDKEQKTIAYKLIALGKIFSKNFDQADSALLLMLKTNPQYEFTAQDPPEIRKRLERFKVHSLVEVTANFGLVQPSFKLTEVYNARPLPATVTYKGKAGYHFGLSSAWYFNKHISLRVGYEWQNYSFSVQNTDDLGTGILLETQSHSQLQVAAGYNFFFGKISLQTYGGITYSTLKKAEGYLVLDRLNESGEIEQSYSNLDQRTKNELRPMVELKLNVPQKNKWLVSLSFRYELGIQNMTNSENRNSNLAHATVMEWVEDDFKGRSFVAAIGISKLYYHVKLK